LANTWDEDPTPSGQARNGDGITNYEEYRGFSFPMVPEAKNMSEQTLNRKRFL
jgi:hypothetical protein